MAECSEGLHSGLSSASLPYGQPHLHLIDGGNICSGVGSGWVMCLPEGQPHRFPWAVSGACLNVYFLCKVAPDTTTSLLVPGGGGSLLFQHKRKLSE